MGLKMLYSIGECPPKQSGDSSHNFKVDRLPRHDLSTDTHDTNAYDTKFHDTPVSDHHSIHSWLCNVPRASAPMNDRFAAFQNLDISSSLEATAASSQCLPEHDYFVTVDTSGPDVNNPLIEDRPLLLSRLSTVNTRSIAANANYAASKTGDTTKRVIIDPVQGNISKDKPGPVDESLLGVGTTFDLTARPEFEDLDGEPIMVGVTKALDPIIFPGYTMEYGYLVNPQLRCLIEQSGRSERST